MTLDLVLLAVAAFGVGYVLGFGKGQGKPAEEAGPLALVGLLLAGAAVGRLTAPKPAPVAARGPAVRLSRAARARAWARRWRGPLAAVAVAGLALWWASGA